MRLLKSKGHFNSFKVQFAFHQAFGVAKALQANQNTDSLSTRKQQFESEFTEWITAQNAWIEAHGIPGADLRPW